MLGALQFSFHPHSSTAEDGPGGERSIPALYDLIAVSNHVGGLGGGHYTATVKDSDGQWMYCDDERVMPCAADEVVTNKAYILIYAKQPLKAEAVIVGKLPIECRATEPVGITNIGTTETPACVTIFGR